MSAFSPRQKFNPGSRFGKLAIARSLESAGTLPQRPGFAKPSPPALTGAVLSIGDLTNMDAIRLTSNSAEAFNSESFGRNGWPALRRGTLSYADRMIGAGDGNRTRTASLEGWDSTIELHPRAAET
jgi:hypothetical protein